MRVPKWFPDLRSSLKGQIRRSFFLQLLPSDFFYRLNVGVQCRRRRSAGTTGYASWVLLLLWHCRGMVARNEPLLTVPAIGVGVASADLCPCLSKRGCVKTSINRPVATQLNGAQVHPASRAGS